MLAGSRLAAGAIVAAGIVTGISSAAAAPSSEFSLAVVVGAAKLTSVGGAIPVTYTTSDQREHALTTVLSRRVSGGATTVVVATDQRGRTAKVTATPLSQGLRISVEVTPRTGVTGLRLSLAASPAAHFLGSGERTRWVDLRRTVQPLKVWNGCQSSAPAPFFASSSGFGAYIRGDPVGRIAFPNATDDSNFACDLGIRQCSVGSPVAAVRICVKSATATVDVFRGTPRQLVSRYVSAVGKPLPPWLPNFGLMQWRDTVDGPTELLDDIQQLRSRGLPIGWVILDNPWEQGVAGNGCFGSLQFDPATFPDPAGLIRTVHSLGVRFMLWVSPELRKKGCPPSSLPDGWLTSDDDFYLRDLTNPPARADFVDRLRQLASLGVDGFKGDRGDEVDLEKVTLHGGPGAWFQNVYPRLYQQAVADAIAPYRRHWASLFRAAAPGSAAIVPGFVGDDAEQSWNGLQASIHSAQTAGVAGEAMWGSDIGGYQGGDLTPEVFVRWAQFGALTPIFEVGGAGPNATFWQFGQQTVAEFAQAATLHYELAPYLFELVREASRDGLPPIRPLGLTWPADSRAWARDLEFTLGDSLLAAPVVAPANGGTAVSNVYLPAGTWIDVFSGRRQTGRRVVRRVSGPSDFPFYLRAGSALPFNFRAPQLWSADWRPDDLRRSGRQGWLVAPALHETALARTGTARLSAAQSTAGRIEIQLSGAAREQQLQVLTGLRVCRVTAGGRVVPRVADSRAVVGRERGWLVERTGPHALVIKLRTTARTRIVLTGC